MLPSSKTDRRRGSDCCKHVTLRLFQPCTASGAKASLIQRRCGDAPVCGQRLMVNLLCSLHCEATQAFVQHRSLLAGELQQHSQTSLSRSRPLVRRSVVAFAKSAKRAKYSQTTSRPSKGQPLFIQVEPDGSDAWRLDAVVDALKSGSVSVIAILSRAYPLGEYEVWTTLLNSICFTGVSIACICDLGGNSPY